MANKKQLEGANKKIFQQAATAQSLIIEEATSREGKDYLGTQSFRNHCQILVLCNGEASGKNKGYNFSNKEAARMS